MSENDGKIHTVYMRDPLKIKSQNLPYKKTDLWENLEGLPWSFREMVLVERSLLAADFHCKRDLSTFSERGSSSQYEKSPFGIGTALGLPGQN